ncbi:hypothetical protein BaRGS_00025100, partial [Batillaria attramentaria]
VPATREVLASLPNVFSALCLNTRGLEAFVACRPFDRLFKVLLSPDYLPAMRRRRSADPFGDTASNLGNAMDELMRHQPSLRTDATKAIIKLLEEICSMGQDPKYICQKQQPKTEQTGVSPRSPQPMKFVEAILSNNSTDDHCREFVAQKGLLPLMGILGLPNLPIDFPASPACQAVASVCKSILTLSREPQVMKQGLLHLNDVLQKLEPLHKPLGEPGGSVLLQELASASSQPDATLSPQATPLLHALAAAHAYITMFVHVCRMGQNDIRTISVSHWGSELGLTVLQGLSQLYTSLVWESTVLLALCSEDILPPGCPFGRADMDRIIPRDVTDSQSKESVTATEGTPREEEDGGPHSNGMSAAMESLSTSEPSDTPMEVTTGGEGPNVGGVGGGGSSRNTGSGDRNSMSGSSTDKESAPGPSTAESGASTSSATGKKSKMSPVLQAQIRQLKPLLSVSSRLGRALAELFGLLVKLCVGSPVRQRRSHHQAPNQNSMPSPAARAVASALTRLLANGLSWEPPHYAPVPKLRLTFLVCSVGFTSPMLFDEKKQPYHLMLQKFVACGGQAALFQAFSWALSIDGKVPLSDGLEHPDLPDGSGEFLDAWLMLMEKMVNPKTVLESPHSIPNKSKTTAQAPTFNATQYLISTQKAAFNAVMNMWNKKPLKVYGSRMCESLLAILCHIIRGESIIKEQLAKEKEEEATTSSEPGPPTAENPTARLAGRRNAADHEVNPHHLQQLMDMGFTREHAMDALMNTNTLEQATDYVLTHPAPPAPFLAAPGGSQALGMDVDLSDEDQMLRAIALSLGENAVMSTDQSVLDDFTDAMLPGCLNLLDMLPETVYRVCDLLTVVTSRNGSDWRDRTLATIVSEVHTQARHMLEVVSSDGTNAEMVQKLTSSEEALKFGTRLHLLSLLLEDMNLPCAEAIHKGHLLELLVAVLTATHHLLATAKDASTPKWLAPLLLLLDLFEKISVISKRKAEANRLRLNEETGNRRPVMLSIPTAEEKIAAAKEESKETSLLAKPPEENKMETETPEEKPLPAVTLVGLNEEQISNIIRSLVSLITIPIESDTLHALLRLCLRLTRDHHFAVQFASLGGPRMLLGLTQSVAFPGFLSLVTLLFRHILDEPTALRHCMEKVMRSACTGMGSSASGVSNGIIGSKEMHYVLRVLGPAACRNPTFFSTVARDSLQIALPPQNKIVKDEDEVRYIGPNAPQILKCSSLKMVDLVMDPAIRDFLFDLLNALVVKYSWKQDEAQTSEVQPAQTLAEAIQEAVNEATSSFSENSTGISVQNSTAELPTEEDTANQSESNQETTDKESKDTKPADDKKARPLIPKSAILRLLSEVIKSYSNCTQLITQYNYEAGQSELVAESCSLLAFVLDQLLPQCQTAGDKDCPALARVFLASIASCIHCPEAQTTLVSEVKAALQRALTLPESTEKHSRVQALMAIISTIIEACPTPGTVFKGQQTPGNTMVKLLIRKGLVTDLARVPHSLDLSSPYMATTVNAALKPLETLSRAVNLPVQSATTSAKNKAGGDGAGPIVQEDQGGTTHPAADNAEGGQGEDNVTIEDVTNNPDAQADLENTHHQDIVEPDTDRDPLTSEAELDQIMDRLLQRGQSDPEQQVIGDISMMTDQSQVQDESQDVLIDVEVETDDMDHDSSQMAAQENSDGEDDALHPHPALHPDADHDDSPDSPSEAEDEEDYHELDQDDEADEDDEEDDEDEEGSDMEADDDDYHEMDNSLMPNQDDDFLFHLEDMHSGNNGGHIVLSDNAQIYQLPVSMHDADNANEVSVPSLPPAPSGVSAAHPLLVRQSEPVSVRVHRARQRGSYRFTPGAHTFHVNVHSAGGSSRQPNPPVILQRLLGPSAAADILQLTSTLTSQASVPLRTHILANDDLRIISRPDEDFFEELFQDPYPDSGSAGSGVLSSIPSTLIRWTEEARVLDGDSVHDCVTVVKPDIIECLVKKRDAELAEWREKRKKAAAENAAAAKDKAKDSANASGADAEAASAGATSATTTTTADVVTSAAGNQQRAADETERDNSSFSDAVTAAERLALSMVQEAMQAGPFPASSGATGGPGSNTTTPAISGTTVTSTAATPIMPCSPPTMLTVRRELNPAMSSARADTRDPAIGSSTVSTSTPAVTSGVRASLSTSGRAPASTMVCQTPMMSQLLEEGAQEPPPLLPPQRMFERQDPGQTPWMAMPLGPR